MDKSGNRIHFFNATCESTLSTQIWSLKLEDKKHTLHIARSGEILDFNYVWHQMHSKITQKEVLTMYPMLTQVRKFPINK